MNFSAAGEKLIVLGSTSGFTAGKDSGFTAGKEPSTCLNNYLLAAVQGSPTNEHAIRKLICIDYHRSASRTKRALGIDKSHCVLVRTEPSVVLPSNFSSKRNKDFGVVITLGGGSNLAERSLPWPQVWPSGDIQVLDRQLPRLENFVTVSGNKISLISGELYSLRRKCIKKLSSIDLFGTGWDIGFNARLVTALKAFVFAAISLKIPRFSGLKLWFSNQSSWLGEVEDKRSIMANYKYALVIENSQEYMSEKLFDAFFAGCIPVYIGPAAVDYGIPQSLVIQSKPDVESIQSAMAIAKRTRYEDWRMQLEDFLTKESTKAKWSYISVYQELAKRALYTSK